MPDTVTPRVLADTPVVPKKQKRSKFKTFLNTKPDTPVTPAWSLFGNGVTSQTLNYNPQTEDETYIHQDSGETEVTGYKPTIPTPQTAMPGDPVYDYIDGLRRKRAVLADARSEVLLVYAYLEPDATGNYPAERNACSIQIDDFGGDGGTSLKINYTVNLVGDPVIGTFNPTTKAFTPDSSPA